ncbi:MAG: phospho-sugar mutase [Oscillospiraceae bacterium]|nr:phospho-sugar mutase [Oscillospiraceae bacterium]
MNLIDLYNKWLDKTFDNRSVSEELLSIKDDKNEIFSRFGDSIKFGTAGVRALMGAGPNRINVYTVAQITQAISKFILDKFVNPSVVISYDTRKNSELFAVKAVEVFAGNAIKVYIFKEFQPTPLLSFAVRQLKTSAGIMITASHNGAQYNGYKVYDDLGSQIVDVGKICEYFEKIDVFNDVKTLGLKDAFSQGAAKFVNENLIENYIKKIIDLSQFSFAPHGLNLTYSPLNGCAGKILKEILKRTGFKNLNIVKLQEAPDENFTSCQVPNPEKLEAFEQAFVLAKTQNSDIIILNDPDGDRLGVAVPFNGSYQVLSGNTLAALFLFYFIERGTKKNVLIKSIVSGGLADEVAKRNKIKIIETLPGFKYVGKQLQELEFKEASKCFLMGFEESGGFLFEPYIRDKDGIHAACIACEMTAYFKHKRLNLMDILENLYETYGFYSELTLSCEVVDSKRIAKVEKVMKILKDKYSFGTLKVLVVCDYRSSTHHDLIKNIKNKIDLPISDVLSFELSGGNRLIVRPSGTEPLIKFYILANGKTKFESESRVNSIKESVICYLKDTKSLNWPVKT